MYDIDNSPPIIWERKNNNDNLILTWFLIIEYSYRLKLAYPDITIKGYYDKFNKNLFSKIGRPDSFDFDNIDYLELTDVNMGYYFDIDGKGTWFEHKDEKFHRIIYQILLDKGIEF